MNIEIYIATHKNIELPKLESYIPIQVGASFNNCFLEINDSTKINIRKKNKNFCELTALYWIWKNSTADIVGLSHYRRYFIEKKPLCFDNIINKKRIANILKSNDLILPKIERLIKYKNVEESYKKTHHIKDWIITRKVIAEHNPEYLETFDLVSKSKNIYQYNMLIAKKKIFDEYVSWLLNILFEVEKRVDISSYDDYNKRIFGFLSERLMYVFVVQNKLKVYECPVYNIEENLFYQTIIPKIESGLDKIDGIFNNEKKLLNRIQLG